MDPNANLEEQLLIAQYLIDHEDDQGFSSGKFSADAIQLADLVTSLHQWLTSGGALPKAWGEKNRG